MRPRSEPEAGLPRVALRLALAGVALVLIGIGFAPLNRIGADAFPAAEFVREARAIVLPSLAADAPSAWSHALALAQAWPGFAIAAAGQWDARLLGALHTLLAAGALVAFLACGRRHFSPRGLLGVAAAGVTLLLVTPTATRGTALGALGHAWWLLALAHLSLSATGESRRSRAIGWACGGLGLAAATLGLAASLAGLLRDLRSRDRVGAIAHGVLVAVGTLLAFQRDGSGDADIGSLLAAFGWPMEWGWGWPVLWAPLGVAVARWLFSGNEADARLAWVGPLGLATLFAALGFIVLRTPPPHEWLNFALLLNAASLAALPGAPQRRFVLGTVWLIVVANGFVQTVAGGRYGKFEPLGAEREIATDAAFRGVRVASTYAMRAYPSFHSVLPISVRAPLDVTLGAEPGGFGTARPEGLEAPDKLPFFSSWDAEQGAATHAEFRSGWLRTSAPLLQVRVAGTLRPPDTALVLVTADGREIAPLGGGGEIGRRWKRLNFAAPEEAFRIVARDRSGADWIAFTAPLEASDVMRTVAKITQTASWWSVAGVIALATAAWLGGRRWLGGASAVGFEWRVVPWLATFAFALFFAWHVDHIAGPNDAGGYINLAKTFASGRMLGEFQRLPLDEPAARDATLLIPSTAKATAAGGMAPEYPPGLPLLIAAAGAFLPLPAATTLTLWLHLVAGVLVVRFAARGFGLPDAWAWLAAGIGALNSVFLFHTLQPQSDGPSMVWITAAVAWAWAARERAGFAWLAGAATAVAVLMRPANVLCFLPVVACLIDRPRLLLRVALAGAPAALWLFWFNHRMYGSPLLTGYGEVTGWWAWEFVPTTLASYARWLPAIFTPVVVLAFAAPWLRVVSRRLLMVLGLWAGGFLVFYVCYWATYSDWFNMRFVLPGMPALIILGLHVLRALLARTRWRFLEPGARVGPSAALVALLLGATISDSVRRDLLYFVHACAAHRAPILWLNENVQGPAAIIAEHASNAVWHYSDFILLRAKHPAVRSPEFLARIEAAGLPVYAVNQHWERKGFVFGQGKGDGLPDLPGRWELRAVVWEGEYSLWRWHPPVGTESVKVPSAR